MGTVVGHFRDRASADAAYDELRQRGFSGAAISVVERGRDAGDSPNADEPVTAGQGAAVGGIAGVLIGVGAMLIPGVGPILAAGPIAAALAGAVTGGVTGAVTGGLAGALVDAGVDEAAARYYDEAVQAGGVLVTVDADAANAGLARDVLERHGADLRDAAGAAVAGGSRVRQSVGTDPGAVGFPDPQPRIGDDPGVVDTPYRTASGMTGFDTPARAVTPPPDPAQATRDPGAAPSEPQRSGGPPII